MYNEKPNIFIIFIVEYQNLLISMNVCSILSKTQNTCTDGIIFNSTKTSIEVRAPM